MNNDRPFAPIVYLTAELKSRDLDSRLLIAAHLLKLGVVAVVGQQWAMWENRYNALKGCYFFKTMNVYQAGAMRQVRKAGHIVVAADEEALCCAGDLSLDAVHPEAMAAVDLLFAQNADHHDILVKAYPEANISIGGSARVDLLEMAKRHSVSPLNEPYILFNTNFPLTNGFMTTKVAAQVVKDLDADIAYEMARVDHLTALIEWCVENLKTHRIVIRPHPGEKIEPWRQRFGDKSNVLIVGRSDPVEWIAGADVLIVSDSTTGLEAALMNKACLNISPREFEHRSDERLMRHINFTVPHARDAIQPLMEFLTQKTGPLAAPAKKMPFPSEAARRMAGEIVKEFEKRGLRLPADLPKLHWAPMERKEFQREKFTVTPEEARLRARKIFEDVGVKSWEMAQLDDSLFLFFGRPGHP